MLHSPLEELIFLRRTWDWVCPFTIIRFQSLLIIKWLVLLSHLMKVHNRWAIVRCTWSLTALQIKHRRLILIGLILLKLIQAWPLFLYLRKLSHCELFKRFKLCFALRKAIRLFLLIFDKRVFEALWGSRPEVGIPLNHLEDQINSFRWCFRYSILE